MRDPGIDPEIERIRQIYHEDILPHHCRDVILLGRKCAPQILYTFLGFELKMGSTRLNCPDMSTARYLKVFAELGMKKVKIPYDLSRLPLLVNGLEHSLHRIKEHFLERGLDSTRHAAALRRIYARIRKRLPEN